MTLSRHFAATAAHHSSGGWPFLLIAVLILAFALTTAINPKLQWKMRSWQFKNQQAMEPSRAGLVATRISSGVVAAVAVVFVVIGISKL